MPVNEGVTSGYLQLGVAGAALLIVLVMAILNARQNKIIMSSSNQKVDKLCEKIEKLITVSHKEMISNDKDQEKITSKLDLITTIAIDNQRRIARTDERTYRCLGNRDKEVS